MFVELAPAEIVSGPYSSMVKGYSLPAGFDAGKMTEIVLMRDWNRVIAPASTIIEIVLAFHAKHLMRGVVQRTRGYVYASDLLNIKGELKDAKYPASPFPSVADFYPGPPFSQRMYSVPRFLVDIVRAAMAGAKSRTVTGSSTLDGYAAADWNLIQKMLRIDAKRGKDSNSTSRATDANGHQPPAEASEDQNLRGSGA
jgi:hypothetical protein